LRLLSRSQFNPTRGVSLVLFGPGFHAAAPPFLHCWGWRGVWESDLVIGCAAAPFCVHANTTPTPQPTKKPNPQPIQTQHPKTSRMPGFHVGTDPVAAEACVVPFLVIVEVRSVSPSVASIPIPTLFLLLALRRGCEWRTLFSCLGQLFSTGRFTQFPVWPFLPLFPTCSRLRPEVSHEGLSTPVLLRKNLHTTLCLPQVMSCGASFPLPCSFRLLRSMISSCFDQDPIPTRSFYIRRAGFYPPTWFSW